MFAPAVTGESGFAGSDRFLAIKQGPGSARRLDEGTTMKSATALGLLAVGAIFAFAITAHPAFLNLQATGWVIMLAGVVGLLVRRRGSRRLRRSVIVTGGSRARPVNVEGRRYSRWLMPGGIASTGIADQAVATATAEELQGT